MCYYYNNIASNNIIFDFLINDLLMLGLNLNFWNINNIQNIIINISNIIYEYDNNIRHNEILFEWFNNNQLKNIQLYYYYYYILT